MVPLYIAKFIKNADELFEYCLTLPWWSIVNLRQEYFMAAKPIQYDYGKAPNVRSYNAEPFTPEIQEIMELLNYDGSSYNMCFMNRYNTGSHNINYHSDNSPSMDDSHSISVISLGAIREICWREIGFKGNLPESQKQMLGHGSLFIMPPYMQLGWQHKISKSDRPCGTRISLTFRRHLNV